MAWAPLAPGAASSRSHSRSHSCIIPAAPHCTAPRATHAAHTTTTTPPTPTHQHHQHQHTNTTNTNTTNTNTNTNTNTTNTNTTPRRDFIVNGKGDPAAADNNGTASGAAKADGVSGEPTTGDAPVKMDVDA